MIPQKLLAHFDENLATIPELFPVLQEIVRNLDLSIKSDESARTERMKDIQAAVKTLTATNDVKVLFAGGSEVESSVFVESFLNITNAASSELLPPSGPVKIEVYGDTNQEIDDLVVRQKTFWNYFLTDVCKEFRPEIIRAIMWSALSGDGFVKVYYHPLLNRPTIECVSPEDLLIPAKAPNLDKASRITQILNLSSKEVKHRVNSGFYKAIDLLATSDSLMEDNIVDNAILKGEGMATDDMEDENVKYYKLYESQVDITLRVDGYDSPFPLPFIITYEAESLRLLSCYTNFDKNDPTFSKIKRIAHFPFVLGLKSYGMGLAQMALKLSNASTALLRQTIDLNTLSNLPSGFYSSSTRLQQTEFFIEPLKFKPIDLQGQTIDQTLMFNKFNPPSGVGLQLKESMDASIQRLAASATLSPEDFGGNMPVASALAMIDMATKPQSAVIRNFHQSMKDTLEMFERIFKDTLSPQEPYPMIVPNGQNHSILNDMRAQILVTPVTDPNLSSQTQRVMRAQALMESAQQFPQLYDLRKIVENYLRALNIPNYEEMLVQTQNIAPADPITENMNAMQGQGLKAGEYQDHDAHISAHSLLLMDPNTDDNKKAIVQAHIAEHQALKFYNQVAQQLAQQGIELPPPNTPMTPEQENYYAQAIVPVMQQMQQELLQAMQPPAQPDPNYELMKENLQLTAQYNDIKLQHEETQMKMKHQEQLAQAELKARELQIREKEINWRIEKEATELGIQLNLPMEENMANAEAEEMEVDLPLTQNLPQEVEGWEALPTQPQEMMSEGEEIPQENPEESIAQPAEMPHDMATPEQNQE